VEAPRYCYRHPDRETGLSCSECGRPICYECMTPAPVGLRCPDHSGKPQGVQKVTRAVTAVGTRRVNPVTIGLIALNVGVYLAEIATGGNASNGTGNTIYYHGALFGPLVANGDWWRLFTSAFLHYGPIHLGLNMWALYIAGTLLERVIGSWRFAMLYLVSGIAGSAGALLLSFNSPTVGASGAIFGVFGALLVLERRQHISTGGQILGLVVLNLVLSFAVPGISIGGHIGGLIAGIVLMLLLLAVRRNPAVYSLAAGVAVGAIAIVVAYLKVRNYQ
jgi:membrane associated rhomboid family serine protease